MGVESLEGIEVLEVSTKCSKNDSMNHLQGKTNLKYHLSLRYNYMQLNLPQQSCGKEIFIEILGMEDILGNKDT